MCRLFGFRSVIQSQVHESLVRADNALELQSNKHPDGWGVAYFVGGAPHIIKSEKTAVDDAIFKKISGIVSSQTVLAHIRNATLGQVNILNTHPFQFGNWVFAHNGNIKGFADKKEEIMSRILPHLRRFILGNTDSEVVFYFILSHLSGKVNLYDKDCNIDVLAESVKESVQALIKIIGPYSEIDDAGNTETYLTFILTNGQTMLAHHGGKNLFYSTYKNRCGDRDTCPSFAPECEAPTETGYVNHLIFSSEPLSGDNIWHPLSPGEIIGVDNDMKLRRY
ncbi:class II glutamine amidotransferase [Halobacteriovorax sp. GB3]|uniref:class II glutamine amidotransferase n=1 Tax=Halobacteriovorax sp. GB3 TaxID=2719615 RepID=UPI0023628992|nr:class II glutamine amidotransferase [Halobacteriovorax sp. GB3]MDD0854039.1 class II glutamine amidotransferase [Halobacteriovorax sp. GB3]